jgi:hypothetical protein
MDWAPVMGPEKYGITPGPASNTPTELHSVVTPSASATSAAKLVSLDNPYTAFALIAAVTFGFMAFSTSVRVGKTLKLGDA